MGSVKILTSQTWVTRNEWYQHAGDVRKSGAKSSAIPFLLSDRSMCQDPYLDPYEHDISKATAVISGCCRYLSNTLEVGDILIYITNAEKKVLEEIKKSKECPSDLNSVLSDKKLSERSIYLGIAILKVTEIIESHEVAAQQLENYRQYVPLSRTTLYPPNLASNPLPDNAACLKDSSITYIPKVNESIKNEDHKIEDYLPLLPKDATNDQYKTNYSWYHARQKSGQNKKRAKNGLKVALCEFVTKNPICGFGDPKCPRHLNVSTETPVITRTDLKDRSMNSNGLLLNPDQLGPIISKF